MDDIERWATRLWGAVATVAVAVAGAWPWLYKWWGEIGTDAAERRKQAREEAAAEEEQRKAAEAAEIEARAIPYRKAWQEVSDKLNKALEGMTKLTAECTDYRVRIAQLESDNRHCQAESDRVSQELAEQREESDRLSKALAEAREQSREQERKLWEEIRGLKREAGDRESGDRQ